MGYEESILSEKELHTPDDRDRNDHDSNPRSPSHGLRGCFDLSGYGESNGGDYRYRQFGDQKFRFDSVRGAVLYTEDPNGKI